MMCATRNFTRESQSIGSAASGTLFNVPQHQPLPWQ